MMKTADEIENQYGHYFDATIVNDDLETAFTNLRQIAFNIESQPHWIPASWLLR
jgi:guanylate kinase